MENTIIQRSIELAERWQHESHRIKSKRQIEFDEKVSKMVRNPVNKVFLTELIDQAFRPRDSKRVADQIVYLLNKYKDVDLFDSFENLLIELFQKAGKHVPTISVPAIVHRIRSETADVILDAERDELIQHIRRRKKQQIGVNLNVIGEALLGEQEAARRMQVYRDVLALPEVSYISIKISTLYSQISSLAFEQSVLVLVERLSVLYRHAQAQRQPNAAGVDQPKFINLDMEEYKDLALTVETFKRTLDLSEFRQLPAGIVLQAYLPDALYWQRNLTEWAQRRVAAGGAPIKIRLVKGANMDMEQTEASLRCWPQAPYHEKLDTDANYKRMLRYAFQPQRAASVSIGIASHNLFELAHAHLLAQECAVEQFVVFEMLEGMADATARILHAQGIPILLYAPVATRENFTHAIAYYVRRLDENTSPQNFLTHCFNLKPGDSNWEFLSDQFRASFSRIATARERPLRDQDRSHEAARAVPSTLLSGRFESEADTDWSLPANRRWAQAIVEKWRARPGGAIEQIPVSVGDSFLYQGLEQIELIDQSQHEAALPIGRYALAGIEQIDQAMEIAARDDSGWAALSAPQRHRILAAAARELRLVRADLLGVAAAEVGKLLTETDTEVSEAIDFAEFYPLAMSRFAQRPNLLFKPKGVGVVISPWNFPIAIPAGGVLASLAGGNNTIFKPSPQAVYCGWVICQALWRAGVPRQALQFLPCHNQPQASYLAAHPQASFLIFTGSTQTALAMLQARPRLPLYAETGGKNAMVVSAVADRDKAIVDIVQSAFGNSGQKCSATSLVLLHRSLYEDAAFRAALVDAAQSLTVGYAWDLKSKFGPLANPVGGALQQSLACLQAGEQWALQPELSASNSHMLSPGILWDVSQQSYCYRHELFGPVLGVMPFDTIEQAVRLVNETNYGLTSGLQSLDDREIAYWRERIRAGNLYINRSTTGAIVMRQPFGGMAKSAIGPGIKVGGTNYPLEFVDVVELGQPQNLSTSDPLLNRFQFMLESYPKGIDTRVAQQLQAAFESSLYEYEHVFSQIEDCFKIRGESNQSRYLKMHNIVVRIEVEDSAFSILSRIFNAHLSQTELTLSLSHAISPDLRLWLRLYAPELKAKFVQEDQSELCRRLDSIDRIRFASPEVVSDELYEAAARQGLYLATCPPLIDGRLELVLYFREQCITHSYHRYGNLGQHQLDPHAADALAPGALPDEVYR